MQDQLCLWSDAESPCQKPRIWEDLAPETQRTVIVLLSKLISRAVSPTPREANNER